MKNKMRLVVTAAAFAITCTAFAQTDVATNGDFELYSNGYGLPNGTSDLGWRFFAVGGQDGACTVTSAAASHGSLGMQYVKHDSGFGDIGLDKDGADSWEVIPHNPRAIKVMVDVKDGALYGGTPNFTGSINFADNTLNLAKSIDPGAAFQTLSWGALSDSAGRVHVRFDLPGYPTVDSSVYLDNVRIYDVTDSGNRVYNGGFENSATNILQWRIYNNAPSPDMFMSLSNDAHSGNNALLVERATKTLQTAPSTYYDAAVDMENDRMPVIAGEYMQLSYWVKRVNSSPHVPVANATARPGVSVVYYAAATGGSMSSLYLGNIANPPTTSYQKATHTVLVPAGAKFAKLALRVADNSGNDKDIGAFLYDDISFSRTTELMADGSFEDGFVNDAPSSASWRMGKTPSSTAVGINWALRNAAASDGAVGAELSASNTAAQDYPYIDRDTTKLRIPLLSTDHIYTYKYDVKDGGPYGGTTNFFCGTATNGGDGYTTLSQTVDPQNTFETYGKSYGSGTSTYLSLRFDLRTTESAAPYPQRSVFFDNVKMADVTRFERVVNPGFENSQSRLVNWHGFGDPTEFSYGLDSDAKSGSKALKITRTSTALLSDCGVDLDSDRIMVKPGEILVWQYSAKQVSGDANARVFVSFIQRDLVGTTILQQDDYSDDNPGTSAYQTFSRETTIVPGARTVSIRFRVGTTGVDKYVGSYLIDDVSVKQKNAKPTIAAANIISYPDPVVPTSIFRVDNTTLGFADADGDLDGYLFQWKRNGVDIPGATGPKLAPPQNTAPGSYTLVVTPFDGVETGTSIESAPLNVAGVDNWTMY